MKYYIGSANGSGIEAETFNEFLNYIADMATTAEEQGDEWCDGTVENYLMPTTDRKALEYDGLYSDKHEI